MTGPGPWSHIIGHIKSLLYGNLDAELSLARQPGHAGLTLPASVIRVVSGFSTLMRAFADEGDELRTLSPIAPHRLPAVAGLPHVHLTSGRLADASPAPVLAWAETPEVASFRRRHQPKDHKTIWGTSPTPPGVVARVHHREFCLRLANDLGYCLPGAGMVESFEDLERHLDAVEPGPWIVKAPLSAAGRQRYIQRDSSTAARPRSRRTIEGLFRRHGRLLFEPWMDRTDDFGCTALVTTDDIRIVGFHRLRVDQNGRFQGLELRATFNGFDGLSAEESRILEQVVNAVGRALREAEYRGPFGIDAWRYRRSDGSLTFHPLGEINARLTFGLVARTLVDRILPHSGSGSMGTAELVLGKGTVESLRNPDVVPLLLPDEEDPTAAWMILRP